MVSYPYYQQVPYAPQGVYPQGQPGAYPAYAPQATAYAQPQAMMYPPQAAYPQGQPVAYPAPQAAYPQAAYAQTAPAEPSWSQGWLAYDDPGYIKGLLLGAGLAYLVTNPKVQRTVVKGAVTLWSTVQGGFEEVKEQIMDIKSEMGMSVDDAKK